VPEGGVDRRRNDDLALAWLLARHREHLVNEERVSLRRGNDPAPRLTVNRVRRKCVDQPVAILDAEWPEEERRRVELPTSPSGLGVEKLGPSHAEEEDRRAAREVGDVLDQLEERSLSPLDVVEDDDLRPLRGTLFEETAERELCLGGRAAEHRVRVDADREEELDERPVRDPLAVVNAATVQDVRLVTRVLEEVSHQPRLPYASRAEQRDQSAGAVSDCVLVLTTKPLPFALAADEHALEVPRDRLRTCDHLEQPERLDALRFSLERQRSDGLNTHGVAYEQPRLRPDEHFPCACRLFQARCHIDGVSGNERLSLATDDNLARVHADPALEAVHGHNFPHFHGCAHRA
jgi:hypothetical protein